MQQSGEGYPDLNQIAQLAALAVMASTAYSLDKACSPKVETSPQVNPAEQAELLKKFMEFNPELQRGMLAYAERMRKGYRKGG